MGDVCAKCTYNYDHRGTTRIYFANGLSKSIDNGVSKSEFLYDLRNFVTSETQTLSGRHLSPLLSIAHRAFGLVRVAAAGFLVSLWDF